MPRRWFVHDRMDPLAANLASQEVQFVTNQIVVAKEERARASCSHSPVSPDRRSP